VVAVLAMPGLTDAGLNTPVRATEPTRPVAARLLAGSSPAVRLPQPSLPTGNAATAVPASPAQSTSRREVDPAREIAARRDATTEAYANGDGTETVVLHTEPVNYRPAPSAAWEKIDNMTRRDGSSRRTSRTSRGRA